MDSDEVKDLGPAVASPRVGFFVRVARAARSAVGIAFNIGCGLVMMFFIAAAVVGNGREALACVGIGDKDEAIVVEIRGLDLSNRFDRRLSRCFTKLAPASGGDLDSLVCAILVTPDPNAANVAPGKFVFSEGLQELSLFHLEAVVAHELAHDFHQHGRSAGRFVGVVTLLTRLGGFFTGSGDSTVEQASEWATKLTYPHYSKAQELEADATAVEFLKRAGRTSSATGNLCGALKALREMTGNEGGGFFSTHPSISDRIRALEDAIQRE